MSHEETKEIGGIWLKKITYMRNLKSFFRHLKGYLVEEGLELFYIVLGAELEPIYMEFQLTMRMNFLMNKTMALSG